MKLEADEGLLEDSLLMGKVGAKGAAGVLELPNVNEGADAVTGLVPPNANDDAVDDPFDLALCTTADAGGLALPNLNVSDEDGASVVSTAGFEVVVPPNEKVGAVAGEGAFDASSVGAA